MKRTAFIKEEASVRTLSNLAVVRRLAALMPLLVCLLPATLCLNFVASSSPSAFRWYAGQLAVAREAIGVPGLGELPVTLEGLLLLAVLATVLRILAWAAYELSAQWSAQRIYTRMIEAVARARTTFFDENPSGRMINRLVIDYNQVRTVGLSSINEAIGAWIDIVAIFLLTAIASLYCGILIAPVLVIFFYLQAWRSPLVIQSRMESSVWGGKVLELNIDMVAGRASYLLYGRFGWMVSRLRGAFEGYVRALGLTIHIESVFVMCIRIVIETYIVMVMLALAIGLYFGGIDPATAGVIISALFAVNGSITYLESSTAQMARQTAHTGRVLEYIDLPDEAGQEHAQPRLPGTAGEGSREPLQGIRFDRLSVSYRADTPLILRDFSLDIPAGSKVGLIGRTGSGKSSVVQALFRLVHVHGGDIVLDGTSLYAMPLAQARRHFGVVPQSPYLFEGTLRANLDRTGELPDQVLLDGLSAVGLSMPLDLPIRPGGGNLSLGQRQLICLARVIAMDKRIILLDEPTSGLDPETDVRIQHVLATALRDRTVITIAHRAQSLRAHGLIVEIDGGAIVRMGAPGDMLAGEATASAS